MTPKAGNVILAGMDGQDGEILIETRRIGNVMEVRAISAHDGLEVVFEAPASAMMSDIEKLGRMKLAYVRRKITEQEQGPEPDPPPPRKGFLA